MSVVPCTLAPMRAAVSGVMRPRPTSFSVVERTKPRPLSTRSVSRSRMTTGTPRRCETRSAICAAMRPAPTMPTLVTGFASDLSGAPTGFLPPETSWKA